MPGSAAPVQGEGGYGLSSICDVRWLERGFVVRNDHMALKSGVLGNLQAARGNPLTTVVVQHLQPRPGGVVIEGGKLPGLVGGDVGMTIGAFGDHGCLRDAEWSPAWLWRRPALFVQRNHDAFSGVCILSSLDHSLP